MRFINELHEGDRLNGIYLCKQKQAATTKRDPSGQDRHAGRQNLGPEFTWNR